jgi:hypothetical protein
MRKSADAKPGGAAAAEAAQDELLGALWVCRVAAWYLE